MNLQEDEVLKNIEIFSPQSVEEFVEIIDSLGDKLRKVENNKQVNKRVTNKPMHVLIIN